MAHVQQNGVNVNSIALKIVLGKLQTLDFLDVRE